MLLLSFASKLVVELSQSVYTANANQNWELSLAAKIILASPRSFIVLLFILSICQLLLVVAYSRKRKTYLYGNLVFVAYLAIWSFLVVGLLLPIAHIVNQYS
ncbi:MAG: hypothetical protein AAFQ41_03700 [Cyanobacteria bacterium J06623_7]